MRKSHQRFKLFIAALLLTSTMGTVAQAAPTLVSPSPASFGEIERITLDDPANVYSSGVIVAGGVEMILPKNLLIDLPANRLSLQQIFDQAPAACKTLGESGLAKADKCNQTGSGGIATISAVRTNAGNVIVGDIFIQKAGEVVAGVVTYINYAEGYYRVNGLPNDPATGAMVRLNDPTGRHTIQSGAGCVDGPNCSPDPRFALDADNYTNTFATGYPVCIPSTTLRTFTDRLGSGVTSSQAAVDGSGDYLCPDANRSTALNEPPVADSRRFAPVRVGDSITAEGNYETINGVRFLSAHTTNVQKALATSTTAGQPDYLFLEEVGIEAPGFQNQRTVGMFIGFTTLANPATDVDIWSIHRDPLFNDIHEFPLASVQGCDTAQGGPGNCSSQGLVNAGANIFKIIYRSDFLKGTDPKLSPCAHLLASNRFKTLPGLCSGGANPTNDFAVTSPAPHEIIARTGRKIDSTVPLITVDVNGNEATNGEYLFPLGLNLGGLGVAEMAEIDLNALNTPVIFEGIPWNLDRRLGPSGCLNGTCEAGALGSFALDPFPFSGLDPRTQASGLPSGSYSSAVYTASTLSNVRNRIFSYVSGSNFNGDSTLIPYALGTFPADPLLISINPTPALNIFAPITKNDVTTTRNTAAVTIDVLANDIPMLGSILTSAVAITTSPTSGSVTVNTDGTITYTPATNFSGTVSFAYTVQNNFFAVSAPATVTVSVISLLPATAVTLIPNVPSQTAGADVTLTAAASGGDATGPYEYRFYWRAPNTIPFTMGRPYSTNPNWTWNTATLPAGTYTLMVYTRHVGSLLDFESRNIITYQLVAPVVPATGVNLTPSVLSPQPVGTPVTFTAAATGGDAGPYQYRFYWRPPNTTDFTMGRPYSTTPTWTWDTAGLGLTAGTYSIMVYTRHVGSSLDSEVKRIITFVLN